MHTANSDIKKRIEYLVDKKKRAPKALTPSDPFSS